MGLKIKFTNREVQILKRMGKEYTDIANELNIQLNTVMTYVFRIKTKLQTHSKAETIIKAMQLGIIEPYQFII